MVDITHLFGGDGLLGCLRQLFDGLAIISQVVFASNQDNGKTLAEMQDLGDPLCSAGLADERPSRDSGIYLLLDVIE